MKFKTINMVSYHGDGNKCSIVWKRNIINEHISHEEFYMGDGKIIKQLKFYVENNNLIREDSIFYHSGKLRIHSIFNEKYGGKYEVWHPNGQISFIRYYDKYHKLDGPIKVWYDDGKVAGLFNYKHGVRDGEYSKFYPNGEFVEHKFFKDGKELTTLNVKL